MNNMSDIFTGRIDFLSLPLPDAITCTEYSPLTSLDDGDMRLIQEGRSNMEKLPASARGTSSINII